MAVIETHDLSKAYKDVQAVAGLNLTVEEHSIFGFLGPNGAGKSTTIKMLVGLTRPSAGRISILGQNVLQAGVNIKHRIGYLPQFPRFYDHLTVYETLRFVADFFLEGRPAAIDRRISETLELVGLSDKAQYRVGKLSGGEMQRLGIGQAQINHPEILILDEPASALDPVGRRDVLQLMEQLKEQTTIFYSTHILDDVERVSDTVAILNQGKLIAQAPIEELTGMEGEAAYSVVLRGDCSDIPALLEGQPWVIGVAPPTPDESGALQFLITVSDEAAAEAQLLPVLIADGRVTVASYGKKQVVLEDIFIDLVENGD